VGLSIIKNKQTIAIAVKYPMRSAAIVISIPPLGMMLQEQEKSCALRHNRDWGRNGIIPGPQVAKRNCARFFILGPKSRDRRTIFPLVCGGEDLSLLSE
jgi:hypothetical protein